MVVWFWPAGSDWYSKKESITSRIHVDSNGLCRRSQKEAIMIEALQLRGFSFISRCDNNATERVLSQSFQVLSRAHPTGHTSDFLLGIPIPISACAAGTANTEEPSYPCLWVVRATPYSKCPQGYYSVPGGVPSVCHLSQVLEKIPKEF